MHVVFILYGKFETVENLKIDMRAQKHQLRCHKGGKVKSPWMESQLRTLPFGVLEYVFPREDLDLVLTTLGFNTPKDNVIGKTRLRILRAALKVKKAPKKFNTEKQYLWRTEYTGIIPIGIREDGDFVDDTVGEYNGWKHEAI